MFTLTNPLENKLAVVHSPKSINTGVTNARYIEITSRALRI
jgi:hypothetical protein